MESYVSVIKNLFFSWYQFSLENPGYPGVIALLAGLAIALMMSLSHRGKTAALRRKFEADNLVLEQDRIKINYHLDSVQQQLQQTKEQLLDKDGQLAQQIKDNQTTQVLAAQSVAELETQIYQNNKDMASVIQTLEADLGMAQQSTLGADGLDSAVLWQRHASAVKQLTERSQSHQKIATELQQNQQTLVAQLSDKDAIIHELQTALESQNSHILQLTRDVQVQKDHAQQAIQKLIAEFEARDQEKLAAVSGMDEIAVVSAPESVHSASVVQISPEDAEEPILKTSAIPVATVPESVQEPIAVEPPISEVPESVEAIVPIVQEPIQDKAVLEKKSWFSPIKSRLSVLTDKAKPTPKKQDKLNTAIPVDVLPDLTSVESVQEIPAVELISGAAEIIESVDKKVVDVVEELPSPKKKSWFSPLKAQFDAITGKDKYYS
jgi:hypothetical protein